MGHVWKRGKYWYIRYDAPPVEEGKRNEKKMSCRGLTEKEARQLLARIEADISRGIYVEPSDITVAQHMREWMDRQEGRGLSPSTIEGYRINFRCHIEPMIGGHKIGKLRPRDVQKFIDALEDKKLSPKTIRNIHGVLHGALEQAVRLELMPSNPSSKVDLPRWNRKRIATAEEPQIGALMNAIDASKYRIPIYIAIGTGMRRGEILALKWEDIDLDHAVMEVCRAVIQLPKRRLVYKSTKTVSGERYLGMPPTLVKILRDHKDYQSAMKAKYGDHYHDEGWVCTHPDGTPLTPGGIGREFWEIKRDLHLNVGLHGLRHTLITEMLAADVPDDVVSKWAGHAVIAHTHNLYGHPQVRHQTAAIEVAERLLNAKPKIRIVGE